MSVLRMRLMAGLAVLGGTIGIFTSPNFRADGHYFFGHWTDGACFLGFALLVGATCWLQGHGSGMAAGTVLAQAEADEREQQDSDRIDRLIELLDAARTDVQDARSLAAELASKPDTALSVARYLDACLDGALSLREQHRATAWPTSRSTYDEVLADALDDIQQIVTPNPDSAKG